MKQIMLWITGGLMLAAAIHILAVLLVPLFAANDAWARLARFGEVNELHPIPSLSSDNAPLPDMDPSLRYAVCRYDLTAGPLNLTAAIPQTYWVLSLHDRHGLSYYTLNDRSIAGRTIEIWVATQEQLLDIAPAGIEEERESRLIVGAPEPTGFAILRLMVPQPSMAAVIDEALSRTDCAIAEAEPLLPPARPAAPAR